MKKCGLLLLVLVVVIFAFGNTQVASTSQVSPLPILEPPVFSQLTAYPVIRIIDGDTIVIDVNGNNTTVRLVGVDTPETVHPTKAVEHYGKDGAGRIRKEQN